MINILFAGYRSEMVLSDLADTVSKKGGFNVFIEKFEKPVDLDKYRILKDLIFVTSQHPSIDTASYRKFYPHAKFYLSPIELILEIRPIKTIYFPHDWEVPLEGKDFFFLNYFDYVIFDNNLLVPQEITQCLNLGNVKSLENQKVNLNKHKFLFLPNNYNEFRRLVNNKHIKMKIFLKLLSYLKIPVKFHNEDELNELENQLRSLGIIVLDKKLTINIILRDFEGIVLTDGYGSIFREVKSMGIKILVLKFIKPDSEMLQRKYLDELKIDYFKIKHLFSKVKPEKHKIQIFELAHFFELLTKQ